MPATTAIRKRKQAYRNAVTVDVASIRYTQTSVKDTFSNGAPLSWTIYMLKSKQIKPRELPLIRIGCVNDQWRTIDNRRLYCFKASNIDKIPAIVMTDMTYEFVYKNQSYNDGTTINLIHDPPPNIDKNQMIMAYDPETSECKRWKIVTVIKQTKDLKLMEYDADVNDACNAIDDDHKLDNDQFVDNLIDDDHNKSNNNKSKPRSNNKQRISLMNMNMTTDNIFPATSNALPPMKPRLENRSESGPVVPHSYYNPYNNNNTNMDNNMQSRTGDYYGRHNNNNNSNMFNNASHSHGPHQSHGPPLYPPPSHSPPNFYNHGPHGLPSLQNQPPPHHPLPHPYGSYSEHLPPQHKLPTIPTPQQPKSYPFPNQRNNNNRGHNIRYRQNREHISPDYRGNNHHEHPRHIPLQSKSYGPPSHGSHPSHYHQYAHQHIHPQQQQQQQQIQGQSNTTYPSSNTTNSSISSPTNSAFLPKMPQSQSHRVPTSHSHQKAMDEYHSRVLRKHSSDSSLLEMKKQLMSTKSINKHQTQHRSHMNVLDGISDANAKDIDEIDPNKDDGDDAKFTFLDTDENNRTNLSIHRIDDIVAMDDMTTNMMDDIPLIHVYDDDNNNNNNTDLNPNSKIGDNNSNPNLKLSADERESNIDSNDDDYNHQNEEYLNIKNDVFTVLNKLQQKYSSQKELFINTVNQYIQQNKK